MYETLQNNDQEENLPMDNFMAELKKLQNTPLDDKEVSAIKKSNNEQEFVLL